MKGAYPSESRPKAQVTARRVLHTVKRCWLVSVGRNRCLYFQVAMYPAVHEVYVILSGSGNDRSNREFQPLIYLPGDLFFALPDSLTLTRREDTLHRNIHGVLWAESLRKWAMCHARS